MAKISLACQPREARGKARIRRLRRLDSMAPGVIYGDGKPNQHIMVDEKALYHACETESFFSQVLQLKVGTESNDVVVRQIQRHPYKQQVLHIDFLRISQGSEIQLHVPIHFLNEENCAGVRQQGGTIIHEMNEVLVSCLPRHLPEAIEVDVAELELNHSIHLSELQVPKGVTFPDLMRDTEHDTTVVRVTRLGVEAEEEAVEGSVEPTAEFGEEEDEE